MFNKLKCFFGWHKRIFFGRYYIEQNSTAFLLIQECQHCGKKTIY